MSDQHSPPTDDIDDWAPWTYNLIADLDDFMTRVNTILMRRDPKVLGPDNNPFTDCDSLELVFLGFHLTGLGADLPPGIETTMSSFREVHEHVLRRLEAEHRHVDQHPGP